jgi:hypothetical protein
MAKTGGYARSRPGARHPLLCRVFDRDLGRPGTSLATADRSRCRSSRADAGHLADDWRVHAQHVHAPGQRGYSPSQSGLSFSTAKVNSAARYSLSTASNSRLLLGSPVCTDRPVRELPLEVVQSWFPCSVSHGYLPGSPW